MNQAKRGNSSGIHRNVFIDVLLHTSIGLYKEQVAIKEKCVCLLNMNSHLTVF